LFELFLDTDAIRRENGIEHLLNQSRETTTTGKIERFHQDRAFRHRRSSGGRGRRILQTEVFLQLR
jgi:hypothetical protein